jgi:hypothetical protein
MVIINLCCFRRADKRKRLSGRGTCDCDIYKLLYLGGASAVRSTAWSKDLRVTAAGTGVLSHAGAALLRLLADRAGLTGAVVSRTGQAGRWSVHDRGRVLAISPR